MIIGVHHFRDANGLAVERINYCWPLSPFIINKLLKLESLLSLGRNLRLAMEVDSDFKGSTVGL